MNAAFAAARAASDPVPLPLSAPPDSSALHPVSPDSVYLIADITVDELVAL
jgi:hypothetical protein